MQINQRYDICREEDSQPNHNSKAYSNYRNHIQHQFHDTSLSFDSIQTPGWTSIVGTENSKSTHALKNAHSNPTSDPHNQILTRLNSLPKLRHQQTQFSNIRTIPTSTKNKNIFVYGSIKQEQKKLMETPKSKFSKPSIASSNRMINQSAKNSSSSNHLHQKNQPNRFSYNSKPNIFFSSSKNSQNNLHGDSRRRISSARSEKGNKLQDQIKERLSVGNYKQKNVTSDFQSNIKTEPTQPKPNFTSKPKSPSKFYSQIHSFNPIREEKYMNRYLQKLNQRTKSNNTVKIFKKINTDNEKQKTQLVKESPGVNNRDILPLTLKRFNTITIHDHLYKKGMQVQTKKQVERMIDESYQKANVLTFTPFISQKSHFLAESKFSRQSIGDYSSGHNVEQCFRKSHKNQNESKFKNNIFTIQEQAAIKQKGNIAEKAQFEGLMKLFMILSNKTNEINEKNLQANIEKLPLSLLQILEPLLTQVYKKVRYDERKFLEVFSEKGENTIKQVASKRQIVVTQTERLVKFLQRAERQQKQKENKENFPGEFNLNRKVDSKFVKG